MLPIIYALIACALVFASGTYFGGMPGKKRSQSFLKQQESFKKEALELQEINNKLESALTTALAQEPSLLNTTALEDMLAPIARTHSIRSKIEEIDTRGLTRNDLSTLLTKIAQSCGLSTCVLVDPEGLPIAANDEALQIDVLAGLSAILHRLALRTREHGRPMPNAFIYRDEGSQLTLARLIPIGDEHFTILATMQGNVVGPDALDPLVPLIRRVLRYEPWAAAKEKRYL